MHAISLVGYGCERKLDKRTMWAAAIATRCTMPDRTTTQIASEGSQGRPVS